MSMVFHDQHLTTACTRPPTRCSSSTFRGMGRRVMPSDMPLRSNKGSGVDASRRSKAKTSGPSRHCAAYQLIRPEREEPGFHPRDLNAWSVVSAPGQFERSAAAPSNGSDVESKVRAKTESTVNAHVVSAAEQLIRPDRNELASHRELGCYSAMLPGGSIRALCRSASKLKLT